MFYIRKYRYVCTLETDMGCYLVYCQFIINLHLDFLSSLFKFYFFFFHMYVRGNKAISF